MPIYLPCHVCFCLVRCTCSRKIIFRYRCVIHGRMYVVCGGTAQIADSAVCQGVAGWRIFRTLPVLHKYEHYKSYLSKLEIPGTLLILSLVSFVFSCLLPTASLYLPFCDSYIILSRPLAIYEVLPPCLVTCSLSLDLTRSATPSMDTARLMMQNSTVPTAPSNFTNATHALHSLSLSLCGLCYVIQELLRRGNLRTGYRNLEP